MIHQGSNPEMITRHLLVTDTLKHRQFTSGHAMAKQKGIGIRPPSMSDLPGLASESHKNAQLANHNPSTGQGSCMTGDSMWLI
jgi:hypothetical protein